MQYPKGTTCIYSYFENRIGGDSLFNKTVFFGLQYELIEYLQGEVVKQWMLDPAQKRLNEVFGFDYFNRAGWQRIIDKHGGRLPIEIKALPEGAIVSKGVALFTIQSTDDELPWLGQFVETKLMHVWSATAVTTMSYYIRKLIETYATQTGSIVDPFHLNDFGMRGGSSLETVGVTGMAHLTQFLGTDNSQGVEYADEYYQSGTCGHSVFASEHSTTTIWGRGKETDAVSHFLDIAPDAAIVSMVDDSEDSDNFTSNIIGKQFKERILNRAGIVVDRPDSGYPPQVSVDKLNSLWHSFGGTVNDRGFKLLDPHIKVIYGDGIDYESIELILQNMVKAGFAVDARNLVFGCGGALLQKHNRDEHRTAIKCNAAIVDGERRDVSKAPKTDMTKASKGGLLKSIPAYGHNGTLDYMTITEKDSQFNTYIDGLETVFLNGEVTKRHTFKEVRERSK